MLFAATAQHTRSAADHCAKRSGSGPICSGRIFKIAAPVIAAAFVAGCSCSPGVPVTGQNDEDKTIHGTQSETASTSALVDGKKTIVVAYNDDTDDGKVQYTANDRVVFPGASLLGWSYSLDDGASWTYGGKVSPPAGYAALWGDPAIVTSRTNYNRVYISSLAIGASKIPASGHHGWMDDGSITGACIARSDDGGKHFAIHSCLSANGDFYDGASMAAAGTATDHRIFAAYVDVPKGRIDVWQSPDGLAPFQQLPNPFPNKTMFSHPRLAYDNDTGALLVAAIESGSQLIYMSRLIGNTWQTPVLASWPTTRIDIPVGTQSIRMAYGFAFDVGAQSYVVSDDGEQIKYFDDAIRLLYTTRDSKTLRLYVRGTACARNLSVCVDVPQWGTTPGNLNTPGHQWNPTVKAWRGFIGLPPIWKATYQTTDDDPGKVAIKQGNLARFPNGTAVFLPFPLISPRIICPDLRNGSSPGHAVSGYWGDYDEAAHVGFDKNSNAVFLLPFSDSSKGCVTQWKFTSNHLHVRAVTYK
jgi:hypothetical protein